MQKEIRFSEDPDEVRHLLNGLSRQERHAVINQAKAQLSRTDFVMYCDFVHQWKLAPHHKEWAHILTTKKRAIIVAPPEAGKSRLTRTWMEWMVGRNQDIAEALIQNTAGQAGDQLNSMGESLKRDRYRMVFPDIKPTDRWSSEKLIVVRETLRIEPTVSGYGINGNYQGKHFDMMVIDDPTDPEDVLSEPAMQKQRDKLKGMLIDRLRGDGHLFGILTRWGDNDLVPTFQEMGIPILPYPVRRDEPYSWGSKLLFPDNCWVESKPCIHGAIQQYATDDDIDALAERKGPDLFSLTFLCQSSGVVRGTRVFGDLLLKGRNYRPLTYSTDKTAVRIGAGEQRYLRQGVGADWGTTVQHQSAMVRGGKIADGTVVITAAWMSPSGSSDEMMTKANEWKNDTGVRNAWIDRSQGSLFDLFKNWGYGAFKGERSVDYRIGQLLTLIATGKFIIDKSSSGCELLWNQLIQYAYDESGNIIEKADDLVDACLYLISALTEGSRQGIGPVVEIRDPEEVDSDMADAYHDNWKPPKRVSEGGGWSGMKEYSDLL